MFHEYRKLISKNDRHTIFERTDNLIIDTIQCFLEAGYANPANKLLVLERASVNLNMIRFFIRLMKEIRTIDNKKYVALQLLIDEIGRMLGGWIRSKKTPPPTGIDKVETRGVSEIKTPLALRMERDFGRNPDAEPKLSFVSSHCFVSNLSLPSLKLRYAAWSKRTSESGYLFLPVCITETRKCFSSDNSSETSHSLIPEFNLATPAKP